VGDFASWHHRHSVADGITLPHAARHGGCFVHPGDSLGAGSGFILACPNFLPSEIEPMDKAKRKTDSEPLRAFQRENLIRKLTKSQLAVKSPPERDYLNEPGFQSLDTEQRKRILKLAEVSRSCFGLER
jgi:hypothetical protein